MVIEFPIRETEQEEHLTTHYSTEMTMAVDRVSPNLIIDPCNDDISEQADAMEQDDFAESTPIRMSAKKP